MDKFKVMHTDIIPLKTFTYCETLVEEVKRPSRSAAATARSIPLVKRSMPKAPPLPYRSGANTQIRTDELPLPRHLASRETRSNSDYLRMMASEISMIRSRKLIAPLKPRGYLPRRKDLFRTVKSSLSASLEMPCEEDDHSLFVGSWTSVSSTETFLSASSSCYATADDEGFD
ncbi:hypothetical protein BGZ58_000419 [Dissophora ornata]|nr:hypothetical protein BGZ58_000419 [Dissophora ornata]